MCKSLFSENDKKMLTPEGDVYRYIGSDKIDSFAVGDSADISFPNGYNKGNRVYKGVCPSITVTTVDKFIVKTEEKMAKRIYIRKLTPTECYKLMGFTAEDCLAVKVGNREIAKELLEKYPNHSGKRVMTEARRIEKMSDAQLFKQAGNSIVVNVLEAIFTSLGEQYSEFQT